MTTVSFPGLGIGEFSFSREAFSIGDKPVYWYGVIIMCGIVVAFLYALYHAKVEGIKVDDVFDLALFVVPCGVIGARLYYVLTTLGEGRYRTFTDVIAVWEGGLAIYGGIIAGALAVLGVCLYKKINVFKVMDMVAPGVMIAQAIGRWGNFCNGEAFGRPVSEGDPLYFIRMGLQSTYTAGYRSEQGVFPTNALDYYHPTFLYESLWNVVGFILITLLYRKKKFNGQVVLSYLAWYGFGRMFIEGLRTDSLYVGPLRISQVVGLVCFVVGAGLLVAGFILSRKGRLGKIFDTGIQPYSMIRDIREKFEKKPVAATADGSGETDGEGTDNQKTGTPSRDKEDN